MPAESRRARSPTQRWPSSSSIPAPRHLRADIPGFIGGVVKSWRKAGAISAAWPGSQIAAPPQQERYRFDVSDFPIAVQEQVARFRRRLSGEGSRGPFRSEGPPQGLRAETVKTRVYGLKLALNAYVETRGGDAPQVTDLAQLLEPKTFQDILMFHWERAVQRRIAPSRRTRSRRRAGRRRREHDAHGLGIERPDDPGEVCRPATRRRTGRLGG